jgi:hypothetical protein
MDGSSPSLGFSCLLPTAERLVQYGLTFWLL